MLFIYVLNGIRTSKGVGERWELPVAEITKPRGFVEERCEAQRRRSDDVQLPVRHP